MAAKQKYLDVIKIWAAVAWADGVIADNERVAMERLIKCARLNTAEHEEALSWLDQKVELDSIELSGLSHDSRLGVYRAAARLAAVDEVVADEEKAFLSRLSGALGISDDEARAVESEILGHG